MFLVMLSAVSADTGSLEQSLNRLLQYQYGDRGAKELERRLAVSARDPEQQKKAEDLVLKALEQAETPAARTLLGRQLRIVGSRACIPTVENMLAKKELRYVARYILAGLECSEAAEALHRALPASSGNNRAEIIASLAERGYTAALDDMVKGLADKDQTVVFASIRALGRLGGPQAVRALAGLRQTATGLLGAEIDHALIRCAESFLKVGNRKEAIRLYSAFHRPDKNIHLRIAALRGLVLSEPDLAVKRITEALKHPAPEMQQGAMSLMEQVESQEATQAFSVLLKTFPPAQKVLALQILGERIDPAAAPGIRPWILDADSSVQAAALHALGRVGTKDDVLLRARAAARAEGKVCGIARAALIHLKGKGISSVMEQHLKTAKPPIQAELIHALAHRGDLSSTAPLFKTVRHPAGRLQHESLEALAMVGTVKDLPPLLDLLVKTTGAPSAQAMEGVLVQIIKRMKQADPVAQALLKVLPSAPEEVRPLLIRILGLSRSSLALPHLSKALKTGRKAEVEAAVRALSHWPTSVPAQDLLLFSQRTNNPKLRVLAFRGYLALANHSDQAESMYLEALKQAERPEDKKLILARLSKATSREALDQVMGYLSQKNLRQEAVQAAIQIAGQLRHEQPERAKEALQRVLQAHPQAGLRRQAESLITEMDQYQGYLLTWVTTGPFSSKEEKAKTVFETAFSPESKRSEAPWQSLTKGIGNWAINLEATYGSRDQCAAYVKTRIWSPADQPIQLELGSDDGVVAWVNGKKVHSLWTNRGLAPRQDLVQVSLQKGWNTIQLKIVNDTGSWGFCCRVRTRDSTAVAGLKSKAR
jgi:HEAT repeat protein